MKNFKSFLLLFLFVACCSLAARANQQFVAATSGAQQVPAVATSGRGTCKASLNSAETQITVTCSIFDLGGTSSNVAHIHGNAAIGTTAPILFTLNSVVFTNVMAISGTVSLTAPQVADLRANRMYIDVHTPNNPNGEIRGQLHVANAILNDYDGDGRTDPTVFRPSEGIWYSLLSSNNILKAQQFGIATDLTANNADFDGDGISDYAAVRVNPANGQLATYILQSATSSVRAEVFGNAALGDQIGTGDFDGDGKYDVGIFRNGLWAYIESSTGATRYFNWGRTNDAPAQGDFDRDGKSDFAVVRGVGGQGFWHIRLSSTGELKTVQLGQTGDNFLNRTDFDGDGASDTTVIRNNNGSREFITVRSSDGQTQRFSWGLATDTQQFGDYDGDGLSDYAVSRSQNDSLVWYIFQSANNQLRAVQWGAAGDR